MEIERKGITLREAIGDRQGVKLDYTKVKKAIMQCELDKQNSECKKMLKDLGIEDVYG